MIIGYSNFGEKLVKALWYVLLITIPVTSFPMIANLLGGIVLVSPLSMIPMLLLIILGLIPYFTRGGKFPAVSKPILLFSFAAAISAVAAFFLPIFPYKGQTLQDRELRALFTLGVGLGFFFCAALFPDTRAKILRGRRAIDAGLLVLLLWSTVQVWVMLDAQPGIPAWVTSVHRSFSIRAPFAQRISGLAYEPSWLGNQLVILYLPLLLASVLTGISAYRKIGKYISIEMVLLGWTVVILVFTKSRISLLSFSAILGGIILATGYRAINQWLRSLSRRGQQPHRLVSTCMIRITVLSILILMCIGLGMALLWVLANIDSRMTQVFQVSVLLPELRLFYPNEALYAVAHRLALAERLIYWGTSFRTFGEYPILGVGPGNAGFFFEQFLPPFGHQLVEIQNVLASQQYGFPNPKSLWLRLLSEHGMIGFIPFILWIVLLGLGAWSLARSEDRFDRYIGYAGLFTILAQVFEGFSLDTYALPQLWVSLGLVTAWLRTKYEVP